MEARSNFFCLPGNKARTTIALLERLIGSGGEQDLQGRYIGRLDEMMIEPRCLRAPPVRRLSPSCQRHDDRSNNLRALS
jgi:hypothetical protein